MNFNKKPIVVRRPSYYNDLSLLDNQYSSNLYNSKSFFIRFYAYLPFIFTLNKLDNIGNYRILDLGCADGPLLPTLHYNNNCSIAVDINENLLVESKNLVKERLKNSRSLHLLRSDAHNLPFRDNNFDLIFGFEVLEHVENFNEVIKEVYRILKDNGVFICTLPIELGPSLLMRTLLSRILKYKRPNYSRKQLIESVFLKSLGERPKYLGYKEYIGELGHENFDWRIIFREIKKNFKYVEKKYIPINFLRGINPIISIKAVKKIVQNFIFM